MKMKCKYVVQILQEKDKKKKLMDMLFYYARLSNVIIMH